MSIYMYCGYQINMYTHIKKTLFRVDGWKNMNIMTLS